MQPKISIITVVYNRVNVIEQVISSVVNQTYKNIEYVIVDGGSTDGTVDVIKRYDSKIAYWISEPDTGIYNAMNKALKIVTGDYVEIIGSDDSLCDKKTIEKVVKELDDDPDILSCCAWFIHGNTGMQSLFDNSFAINKKEYIGGMIPHAGMFVKKSAYEKYGFDESYKIAADYKFFLQCYFDKNIHIKYVPINVVYFETDLDGASSQLNECRKENERIYHELCLPFLDINIERRARPAWKKYIIYLLKKIHLDSKVKMWVNHHFKWVNHRCDNEICRWCK